jgi:SAM-dependent methyltransferase
MTVLCNVCGMDMGAPIYESGETKSLTTMNKFIDGELKVYFCDTCQHCQSKELDNLVEFYAQEYEINLDNEDDDQLYDVVNGTKIYRSEHQANVLISKINLKGKKVLDYGCANAATLKRITQFEKDIQIHLFDVTDKYINIWENFPLPVKWATHTPNPTWNGTLDVVLSFYALEHIADLKPNLDGVRDLLKDGGYFYFLIPNMYQNVADFIVADHVNHFSKRSIEELLCAYGFYNVDVDEESHASAFVVSAQINKSDNTKEKPHDNKQYKSKAMEFGDFWGNIKSKIKSDESHEDINQPIAIYGAGIYGNYIYSSLENAERVSCFLDQNASLIGTTNHGVPILHPNELPGDVKTVFVGLNPKTARSSIAGIQSDRFQQSEFYYLV